MLAVVFVSADGLTKVEQVSDLFPPRFLKRAYAPHLRTMLSEEDWTAPTYETREYEYRGKKHNIRPGVDLYEYVEVVP